ncbi:unnamed protein product [Anisakis simplex]|uniref:C3H1-type domain-containing protein n=1 Tax=Anisakis simplex TaxID=6269 RepID=A0A0M3K500_ANISI|nr:unnamed protein product [Anisakis simplex]
MISPSLSTQTSGLCTLLPPPPAPPFDHQSSASSLLIPQFNPSLPEPTFVNSSIYLADSSLQPPPAPPSQPQTLLSFSTPSSVLQTTPGSTHITSQLQQNTNYFINCEGNGSAINTVTTPQSVYWSAGGAFYENVNGFGGANSYVNIMNESVRNNVNAYDSETFCAGVRESTLANDQPPSAQSQMPTSSFISSVESNLESGNQLYSNLIDPPPPPPPFIIEYAPGDRAMYDGQDADQGDNLGDNHDHEEMDCSDDEMVENNQESSLQSDKERHLINQHSITSQVELQPPRDCSQNSSSESKKDQDNKEALLTCRSQFKGILYKLPKNSSRPQTSEGRTFPLKSHNNLIFMDDYADTYEKKDRESVFAVSNVLSTLRRDKKVTSKQPLPIPQSSSVIVRTATKLIRKTASAIAFHPHQSSDNNNQLSSNNSTKLLNKTSTVNDTSLSQSSLVSNQPAKNSFAVGQQLPHLTKVASLSSPQNASGGEQVSPLKQFGSLKLQKAPSNVTLKRVYSSGTLSRNGMSWRRRRTNEGLDDAAEAVNDVQNAKINRRLLRINDRLFTEDSNACYEFAERGECSAGVFCIYDHDDSNAHRNETLCSALLCGRCRDVNCPYSHNLNEHQLPICDYFERMVCTIEHCPFLHVKYNASLKPCEKFQRGICKLGSDCSNPHRYYRGLIRKRGVPLIMGKRLKPRHSSAARKAVTEQGEDLNESKDDDSVLLWIT